jgi:hypothetical protein
VWHTTCWNGILKIICQNICQSAQGTTTYNQVECIEHAYTVILETPNRPVLSIIWWMNCWDQPNGLRSACVTIIGEWNWKWWGHLCLFWESGTATVTKWHDENLAKHSSNPTWMGIKLVWDLNKIWVTNLRWWQDTIKPHMQGRGSL